MSAKVSRDTAIAAIVAHPTIKAAAAACGITEKTMHAWLNEPGFARKVRDAQEEIARGSMSRVMNTIGCALEVLVEVATGEDINPGTRVSAAKALLDQALRVYELETVQRRLDALERRLHG